MLPIIRLVKNDHILKVTWKYGGKKQIFIKKYIKESHFGETKEIKKICIKRNKQGDKKMNRIIFIEKDQNFQNETTNYWFTVNEENYCISDCNGELSLLDCDGCPILACNDHDSIKDLLIPYYEEHLYD